MWACGHSATSSVTRTIALDAACFTPLTIRCEDEQDALV